MNDQKGERETNGSPAFQRMIDRLMQAIRQYERENKEAKTTVEISQKGMSSSSSSATGGAAGGLPEILGGGGELP